MPIPFEQVARFASAGDNVAIITRTLPAGTDVLLGNDVITLAHTVLEGHRIAVRPIAEGDLMLSWGKPFGTALRGIEVGEYIANAAMLTELRRRRLDFALPASTNFSDDIAPYRFDDQGFAPADPLPFYPHDATFMGYVRPSSRGVGTRNMIVLLGTVSLTGAFVRALEARLRTLSGIYANLDGIVAVAHTEGSGAQPNNRDLLLRTLAGFMVHPNVGAVLAVDHPAVSINNAALRDYMVTHNYPLDDVLHAFYSFSGGFADNLDAAEAVVRGWLPAVAAYKREAVSARHLKIALQCGGSDAFSGISANPLAGSVVREVIRYGGSANLAETDELVGAEAYVLDRVKDLATAYNFLTMRDRFAAHIERFGHSVRGNPSGGNLYRGLYNVYLKSLGAASKRDPDVRLDAVINYAEPMTTSGFNFMDSPGNDLESIAGQVASGCNLIFFTTGNGSITNFPFVPTIKFITTTARFNLLSAEMDVNAGAYLDGQSMDELTAQTLQLTLDIASGTLSAGERAGHAQVQIWRDWRTPANGKTNGMETIALSGEPHPLKTGVPVRTLSIPMFATPRGAVSEQVNLILPTSLCAGQIARMCAEQLTERFGRRFVALAHTEGCGNSKEIEYHRTMLGYLQHPFVQHALLLEHGCEMTHNAYMRDLLADADIDASALGWASIQLDGGIQAVIAKMTGWFGEKIASELPSPIIDANINAVRIGLVTRGTLPDELVKALDRVVHEIVGGGGSVVLSQHDMLQRHSHFLPELDKTPTLAHAQQPTTTGLHIMQMPFDQWNETLVGLGASGVQLVLVLTDQPPLPGHPLVPVVQVAVKTNGAHTFANDFANDYDFVLAEAQNGVDTLVDALFEVIVTASSYGYQPRQRTLANVDFQITRGFYGVSL